MPYRGFSDSLVKPLLQAQWLECQSPRKWALQRPHGVDLVLTLSPLAGGFELDQAARLTLLEICSMGATLACSAPWIAGCCNALIAESKRYGLHALDLNLPRMDILSDSVAIVPRSRNFKCAASVLRLSAPFRYEANPPDSRIF
jgi:hypothetical protein